MTFVSEDLLLHGIIHAHPVVATLLLVTTALNGVSLVRAFLRIFFGPVGGATHLHGYTSSFGLFRPAT